MSRNKSVEIAAYLFILLFVYTATSKFLDLETFAAQLGRSPMLTMFAEALAWGLPLTEIGISILLVFEKTRLVGLYASFSLMTMFTMYIILASRFSEYVPCSCGGVIQTLSWNEHLVLNVAFIGIGVLAVLAYSKSNAKLKRPE